MDESGGDEYAGAPPSLAVIGGGVVAVEMATAYAVLGSDVILITRGELLGSMEPFAGELVAEGLGDLGVDVRTGTSIESVRRDDTGVMITLDHGVEIKVSEVLVATGRAPRSEDIGLEVVGLELGRWIETDDTLHVPGADWLYAVGDVNGRVLLTH